MSDTRSHCPECGTPTDGVSRFCGRCGAQLARTPQREAPAVAAPSSTDVIEAEPPEDLLAERGRPHRALLIVAALSILAGALAVASLRDAPERVTAWGERGGAARDGVTSDRAVEDVSTDLWRVELEPDESFLVGLLPHDVVTVGDALVLIGDQVAVLDAETLEHRWDAPLGRTAASNVSDDGIIVATRYEILTVALQDGRITRRVPLAEDIGMPWASTLLERGDGQHQLLVTTGRELVAVDASEGRIDWRHAPEGVRESVNLIDVGPELVLGHTHSGTVVALDPDTGAVRWQRELWEDGPWLQRWHQRVGDVLVVSIAQPEQQPRVLALDVATGEVRWRHEVDGQVELALLEDDRVLLRPREPGRGELSWVETETGRLMPAGEVLAAVPPTDDARFLSATEVLVATEQGARLVGREGTVWTASVDGLPWSLPVVHGERVFVPTGSGALAVLDRSSGRELIRHHLPQQWHRPLVLVGDHVDPDPGSGRLLRLVDGRPAGGDTSGRGHWSSGTGGAPWGRLYHDTEGDVIAVDHDGIERWRRDRPDRVDWSILAALDDVVLLHETKYPVQPDRDPPPTELVVLDAATGAETDREAAPLDRPVSDGASIWSFTWSDGTTELVRFDLDAEEGELQLAWRRPAPAGQLILADDRLLDIGGATAIVRDPGDGSAVATLALPTIVAGAPVVVGDLLIVTDNSRSIHAVRLSDGGRAWSHQLATSLVADVVAAGDRLYLADANGDLEVLDVGDGATVGRRDLAPPGRVSGGLFAARGTVVVRFDDTVYAVGGPDGPRGIERQRGERIELP